jgi:hypothetical protein
MLCGTSHTRSVSAVDSVAWLRVGVAGVIRVIATVAGGGRGGGGGVTAAAGDITVTHTAAL